jgi:catalase-peroxidase
VADGFRNYQERKFGASTESLMLDRANLLMLSATEMTALVGGMRMLGTNADGSRHGVFTQRPGALTNDFFVNLYDMDIAWSPLDADQLEFAGRDRKTGAVKWTGTRADLIFGHDPSLRAVGEIYAADDGHGRLVHDFVRAWDKVMMLDRFDLA